MDGEKVVKGLEDEVARVMAIIETSPAQPHQEGLISYNKGYLEALEFAIDKIRALE